MHDRVEWINSEQRASGEMKNESYYSTFRFTSVRPLLTLLTHKMSLRSLPDFSGQLALLLPSETQSSTTTQRSRLFASTSRRLIALAMLVVVHRVTFSIII